MGTQPRGSGTLLQIKVDFNGDLDRNRLSIFSRWLELPLAYRFDGFFVEAGA